MKIKVSSMTERTFTVIPDFVGQPDDNKFAIVFRIPTAQDFMDAMCYEEGIGEKIRFMMKKCFVEFNNAELFELENENNEPIEFKTLDQFIDIAKGSQELAFIITLISEKFMQKYNEIQKKAEQTEKKSELPTKSTKQAKRSSKSGKKTQSTDSEA